MGMEIPEYPVAKEVAAKKIAPLGAIFMVLEIFRKS